MSIADLFLLKAKKSMTLQEIAVVVAQSLNRQYDSSFLEIVEELVGIWREKIIRQRLNEQKNEREYFIQGAVFRVERLTDAECSNLGYPERCISRTINTIPKMVRTQIMFDYVGAENFRNPFSKTNPLRQLYNESTRTASEPIWLFVNGRIYIDNFEGDKIGVRGIPINPIEMTMCDEREDTGDLCEEEIEYNCPGDVLADVIDILTKTKAQIPGANSNKEEIKNMAEI